MVLYHLGRGIPFWFYCALALNSNFLSKQIGQWLDIRYRVVIMCEWPGVVRVQAVYCYWPGSSQDAARDPGGPPWCHPGQRHSSRDWEVRRPFKYNPCCPHAAQPNNGLEAPTRWGQEDFKGVIQCTVLPNQTCFLTKHNKFHAADLQLQLLLFSNKNTVVHRKWN